MNPNHQRLLALGSTLVALALPATAAGLSTRSASDHSAKNELLNATAKCHRGEHVVSGGFKGIEDNAVFASKRKGARGWTATTEADSGAKLKVYAYCSKSRKLKLSQHQAKSVVPDTDSHLGSLKAKCGHGQKVVAGGYESVKPANHHQLTAYGSGRAGKRAWKVDVVRNDDRASLRVYADFFPFSSFLSHKNWRVSTDNYSVQGGKLTAVIYCQ